MSLEDPPAGPGSSPVGTKRKWLLWLARLWYGERRTTRFDMRLGRLARHRQGDQADVQLRMRKTITTARWWRRFR